MKLTKKKKDLIVNLFQKAFPKTSTAFLQRVYGKLIDIIESTTVRSLPEHHLYWLYCKWFASHCPEWFLEIANIEEMTDNMAHELFKAKFHISSTAFDNMDQDNFHIYFHNILIWTAQYFFRTSVERLEHEWRNEI